MYEEIMKFNKTKGIAGDAILSKLEAIDVE